MSCEHDIYGLSFLESFHPWDLFLKSRILVMKWMRDEKKRSNKEIAELLSMDEIQVELILRERKNVNKDL